MPKQAHDFQFVQCIPQSIVAFAVAAVTGQHPQHGLYPEAPTESPCGAVFGGGGEPGVILAIGCQTHNIEPVEITKLGEMGAVEACVVGVDIFYSVFGKPQGEIGQRFFTGADDGFSAAIHKQGIGKHTAFLIFGGDDMISSCQKAVSIAVGDDGYELLDAIVG